MSGAVSTGKGPEGLAGSRAQMDRGKLSEYIGNTPLIQLRSAVPQADKAVGVWAKAEFMNPGGSVKDRAALFIVEEALRSGKLSGGRTLIDASSGNTGIAYAVLGAALGFPVEIVIPRNASSERIERLRAHGATVNFSDPLEGTDGAQLIARELAKDQPGKYYYPDQYNNPANSRAHYETTGPEIWRQTEGRVTHLVAGVGTGGTISGTGKLLKEKGRVKVVGVIPDVPMHGIEGLKHLKTSIRPGVLDDSVIDEWVEVSSQDAIATVKSLARREGLFVGTSSGAAVHAAGELASTLEEGLIVTILPDGGERYLRETDWGSKE